MICLFDFIFNFKLETEISRDYLLPKSSADNFKIVRARFFWYQNLLLVVIYRPLIFPKERRRRRLESRNMIRGVNLIYQDYSNHLDRSFNSYKLILEPLELRLAIRNIPTRRKNQWSGPINSHTLPSQSSSKHSIQTF